MWGKTTLYSMMRVLFFLSFSFLASLAVAEEAASPSVLRDEPVDEARGRTVPVKIYLGAATGAPCPVVVFSHGLGGSRENSPYLGEHWAAQGYVAVFVQHSGSDEAVWKEAVPGERLGALKAAASVKSFLDRVGDIPFVLDCLERWNADPAHGLKGRLDLERIGLCGHSFGAVTTQALMGQRFVMGRSFADPRLDAFFLMSPSASRGVPSAEAFSHIAAPVLCMTGTEDGSPIQPELTPESRREVYAALPEGDKYQLVFEDGGHFAFSDVDFHDEQRQPHHHAAVQVLSTRFWDAYLKGDEAAKAWLRSEQPRGGAKLVEADVWEWK